MKLEEATSGGTSAAHSAGGAVLSSKRPVIAIHENHRLVRLTEEIDWTEAIRTAKELDDAYRRQATTWRSSWIATGRTVYLLARK